VAENLLITSAKDNSQTSQIHFSPEKLKL